MVEPVSEQPAHAQLLSRTLYCRAVLLCETRLDLSSEQCHRRPTAAPGAARFNSGHFTSGFINKHLGAIPVMVVLDEKYAAIPPPPYAASGSVALPPFPGSRSHQTIATLPSHLLLKIVYMTFPQTHGRDEGRLERQRRTSYWLAHQLRLVNKSFYIACMHVLRSTYFPAYESLIRAPYTSDPFPLSSSIPLPHGTVEVAQRETQVLDLFITLKVREDVMMDDSELHLEREESFKDLFDLMQPRSRLEDLVRDYGLREGVVHVNSLRTSALSGSPVPNSGNPSGSANPRTISSATRPAPIPFSTLSVSFSPRKVGLMLSTMSRKRTILEVARARDDKLEATAKKLVKQLKVWLNSA